MPSVDVREVEDESRLDDVLGLWRRNRAQLGFLPDAGFQERAAKGTLLIATRAKRAVGYALYDLPRDRVKIIHLCVAEDARRQGVARALVDAISARHRDRRGLELKCRRDFPASELWPGLGFRAVLDVRGRSQAGHLLTVWQLAHEHDDLFTVVEEQRELAVIDHNIFLDLTTERPQGRATRNLLDDWVSELVELCVTDELWHEINQADDHALRARMRIQADSFRRLPSRAGWDRQVRIVAELAVAAGGRPPTRRQGRRRWRPLLRNPR